jgi:hypothetical protein
MTIAIATPDPEATAGKAWLAEYEELKAEQRGRMRTRDHLLYLTLGSWAAVIALAAQPGPARMLAPLVFPAAPIVLGWIYLANDSKVQAIGAYLRDDLRPRLIEATGDPSVLGWETAHRAQARRGFRNTVQMLMDLGTFCLVPAAALVVYWTRGPWTTLLVACSVIEALGLLAVSARIILAADLRTHPAPAES